MWTRTDAEYDSAYEADAARQESDAEWQALNYGDREQDREALPYVTEEDLPLGEYEATQDLIGEYLAAYVNHHTY